MSLDGHINGSVENLSTILENAKFVFLDPAVIVAKDCLPPLVRHNNNVKNDEVYQGDCCSSSISHVNSYNSYISTTPQNKSLEQQIDNGLIYLEMLCNEYMPDSPEFVDINNLSQVYDNSKATPGQADTLVVNDDDNDEDDVIFVAEYRQHEDHTPALENDRKDLRNSCDPLTVRRNPVRSTRSKTRDFANDLIVGDELQFLDSSSEDDSDNKLQVSVDTTKPNDLPEEVLKEWPINVHERPIYNSNTRQIEAFDYIAPEQSERSIKRKPKLPLRRKPKKRYVTRSRKSKIVEEKKCPLQDLQPVVNETMLLLANFVNRVKESRKILKANSDNIEEYRDVVRSQATLYSLVNWGKQANFNELHRELYEDEDKTDIDS